MSPPSTSTPPPPSAARAARRLATKPANSGSRSSWPCRSFVPTMLSVTGLPAGAWPPAVVVTGACAGEHAAASHTRNQADFMRRTLPWNIPDRGARLTLNLRASAAGLNNREVDCVHISAGGLMRSQLHRVLVSAGLAASAVLAISPGAQAQVVRDHRKNPPPAEPAPVRVVVEATPREAPPPVREERFAPRPGFVFITGRWDWDRRAHKWSWIPGHWERERRGQKWRDARWELRNGEYVLVDGDWIQVDLRPTAAPPPRREERVSPRPGFVFVSGRWDWGDGNWQWINGHWERERRGQKWREARWELRNGEYVLVDGDWIQVDLRPTAAPPPPREERVAPRPGFVFVAGRWDWRDGNWQWSNGHWERERATQRWIAGRWELRGDRWEWIEGSWGAFPEYPDQPPPPPPPDEIRAQAGWVTKPGFYKWENGRYSWVRTSRLR